MTDEPWRSKASLHSETGNRPDSANMDCDNASRTNRFADRANIASLIVGIGSAHGDDQVGWLVADQIASLSNESDELISVNKAKSPLDLLNWLGDDDLVSFQRLLICDACHGLTSPGQTNCWTWPSLELEETCFSGSHDLGLFSALRLANQLDRLPPEVYVWGIQIDHVTPGEPVSHQLTKKVPTIGLEILRMAVRPDPPAKDIRGCQS